VADLDRKTVVMSIRDAYADQILAGTKVWEFRRQPLPYDVTTVLVYRSGDPEGRGIVGHFTACPGDNTTARSLIGSAASRGHRMGQADPRYGITGTGLAKYAGGYDRPIVAIPVIRPARYAATVPLTMFGWERAPQSWRYAPTGWADLLPANTEEPTHG
jgi:predicted transcriptional regulator